MDDSAFETLLVDVRPKLHRYCARMTGSVIDGEDVLQEALVKAVNARAQARDIVQPERWLFASPIMRRWIFCAGALARRPGSRMRIPK